ncbi:hypothetical protein POM88_017769 [Heracleum sosnowskyi]|uniref:Uncharacterized protein n=1 Tax=Heracleum sosnowskyi TaxID=360622 RepID=A0AAD8IRH1_9APIA|nr:hypothetical protein POM88_017769 [Heracleum sosnowskyi]
MSYWLVVLTSRDPEVLEAVEIYEGLQNLLDKETYERVYPRLLDVDFRSLFMRRETITGKSGRFYNQPSHEFESQLWKHCQHLDDKLWLDDDIQEMQVSGKAFQSYGTPEAATTTGGYPGTSFAVSLSANGSPISGESSLTYPSGVNHSPGNNVSDLQGTTHTWFWCSQFWCSWCWCSWC